VNYNGPEASAMVVRKSIEYQIQEFAELRGVTPDLAVRIAITEALDREQKEAEDFEEDASHASTLEAIDARRIAIAASSGQDIGVDGVCADLWPAAAILTVYLLVVTFFSRPLKPVVFAFVLFCIAVSYIYGRSLAKQSESRKQMRKSLKLEVEELSRGLPDRLRFLAAPPSEEDPYINLSMLENEKQE
jgi:hypothetical protein